MNDERASPSPVPHAAGAATNGAAQTISILVVEDSELDYDLLVAYLLRDPSLASLRVRTQRVDDEDSMRAVFASGIGGERIAAVITDHNMPRFDSFAALTVAKTFDEDVPVIVLSGEMSEELAVAALHTGADDFILKSRMFRLAPALKRSLQAAQIRRDQRAQAQQLAENEAKLHALTQHLERVKEDERRAVAREIHDDIGTTLTALKFELSRLARAVNDQPLASISISAMQELIGSIISASHRIQHNLHPPVLDAGLVDALDWLVKGFRERTGVAAGFDSNRADIDLAPERAAALYRVAQEALSNVAKHAQASQVSVQLFATADEVALEVADNGVGFDPGMLKATPGFGVRGLMQRARGFGGWAEVNSQPGRGTTVMFAIAPNDVANSAPNSIDSSNDSGANGR